MTTNEQVISKDFQIFAWRGLVYNGALLRTVIQNQMHIMKAIKCVNPETIYQETNDLIKANEQIMDQLLNSWAPEYREIQPPIKNF